MAIEQIIPGKLYEITEPNVVAEYVGDRACKDFDLDLGELLVAIHGAGEPIADEYEPPATIAAYWTFLRSDGTMVRVCTYNVRNWLGRATRPKKQQKTVTT